MKNPLIVLPLLALAACGGDDSAPTSENSASAPAIAATVNEAAEDKEDAEERVERREAAQRRGEALAEATLRRADKADTPAAREAATENLTQPIE